MVHGMQHVLTSDAASTGHDDQGRREIIVNTPGLALFECRASCCMVPKLASPYAEVKRVFVLKDG